MRIYSLLFVLTLGACLSAESSPTIGHGSESPSSNSRDKRISIDFASSLLGFTGLLDTNVLLTSLLGDLRLTNVLSGILNVNETLSKLVGGHKGLLNTIVTLTQDILKTLNPAVQKFIVDGLVNSPLLKTILSHVTGPNGLLTSIGDVLNVVACVLESLGRGPVNELLKAVNLQEQISVLKLGCNSTVGADLIKGLLGVKGGLTGLLNNLVCMVGNTVNHVVTNLQLQLAKSILLSLPGFECSNGTILNGTTSLLGLTSLVDNVLGSVLPNNQIVPLVTNILKNPNLLSGVFNGGLNFLGNILQQVICLLRKLGVGSVSNLVKIVDPKQLLNLDLICVNSSNDLLSTIFGDKFLLNNIPLLGEIACLVSKAVPVKDIMSLTGATDFLTFTEGACEAGLLTNLLSNVSGLLYPLIQELQTLNITFTLNDAIIIANELGLYPGSVVNLVADLACVLKKLGASLVTGIIKQIGIDKLLQLNNYICKDGQPLFNEFDAETQAKFVTLMGLLNVSDLIDIVNALKCLADKLTWPTVLDLAIAVQSLDPLRCEQVTVGLDIGLIAGLVDNVGVDSVNDLLTLINPLVLLDLARIFYISGSFNITLFEMAKCILPNVKLWLNAGGLITSQAELEVFNYMLCPNGSAINFPEKLQQYLDVYRVCQKGLTAECQSMMTATINKDSCKACMTNDFCDGLYARAPQEASTECYAECVACTQATG